MDNILYGFDASFAIVFSTLKRKTGIHDALRCHFLWFGCLLCHSILKIRNLGEAWAAPERSEEVWAAWGALDRPGETWGMIGRDQQGNKCSGKNCNKRTSVITKTLKCYNLHGFQCACCVFHFCYEKNVNKLTRAIKTLCI